MDKNAREYEKTHPWICFNADLREMPLLFWLRLGEAVSKCHHVAGVPLRPDFGKAMHRLYLAKGAQATTAIEGNTLTEEQVNQHLQGKLKLPPSKEYLKQEVQNIVDACHEISQRAFGSEKPDLTFDLICEFNGKVLKSLPGADEVSPGKVRQHSVTVGNYRGAPWQDCEYLLHKMCDWLNTMHVDGFPPIAVALIKAMLAHLYIAWIHPFSDGNGRTARLVEFYILLGAGVASPATHLLSNHYNETRAEYYRQLDSASKRATSAEFLEYALAGFIEGLKTQLALIRGYQAHLAWLDYLRDFFEDRPKKADRRRYELMQVLSEFMQPLPAAKLMQSSGKIATMYREYVPKTLERDLSILEQEKLIEVRDGKVQVRMEIVLQFLPARRVEAAEEMEIMMPVNKLLLEMSQE